MLERLMHQRKTAGPDDHDRDGGAGKGHNATEECHYLTHGLLGLRLRPQQPIDAFREFLAATHQRARKIAQDAASNPFLRL